MLDAIVSGGGIYALKLGGSGTGIISSCWWACGKGGDGWDVDW